MGFISSLRHAFRVQAEKDTLFSDDEHRLLDTLARAVKKRGLITPAILFLESCKPMHFIGSQVLFFFKPVISLLADTTTYEKYALLLSKRGAIDRLLEKIERNDTKQ